MCSYLDSRRSVSYLGNESRQVGYEIRKHLNNHEKKIGNQDLSG